MSFSLPLVRDTGCAPGDPTWYSCCAQLSLLGDDLFSKECVCCWMRWVSTEGRACFFGLVNCAILAGRLEHGNNVAAGARCICSYCPFTAGRSHLILVMIE